MTNADRIRSMSNEELAEFLLSDTECQMVREDICCPECKTCKRCVEEWLNAECTAEPNNIIAGVDFSDSLTALDKLTDIVSKGDSNG